MLELNCSSQHGTTPLGFLSRCYCRCGKDSHGAKDENPRSRSGTMKDVSRAGCSTVHLWGASDRY